MNHIGTREIVTERLVLRPIILSDAEELYRLVTDKDVMKYLAGIPPYTGVQMAVDYISGKLTEKYKDISFYDWGICEKSSGKLIGRIAVYKQDDEKRMADLVWYISPDVRGKGYMPEAGKAVVGCLQEIGFERIEAFANVDNLSSQKVMEKIGMQYEGTLKKYDLRRDGTLYDAKMYAITERIK